MEASNWSDVSIGQRIARLAGMSDEEWQSVAQHFGHTADGPKALIRLLKSSGRSHPLLFCLGDTVLLQYDRSLSSRHWLLHVPVTGQRIKRMNEVVDPSARLSAEYLRELFVVLEALVFKCVHIIIEEQSPRYKPKEENYETQMERLKDNKLLSDEDFDIGMKLYETRNFFAHSLKSIDHLPYRGEQLCDRWGAAGVASPRKFKRHFLSDAYEYSEALLQRFRPVQAKQIDGERFRKALASITESL